MQKQFSASKIIELYVHHIVTETCEVAVLLDNIRNHVTVRGLADRLIIYLEPMIRYCEFTEIRQAGKPVVADTC
jgi:hypothetical protein